MLGRVKAKTDPNKDIIDTLAGPNPGLVAKAEYDLAGAYPVVVTQPGFGIGAIGYNTNCMTYNPSCCVGEDDEGNPIYKGVLRVNCLCADDVEGAGEGEFVKKNLVSDSLNYNLMLWGNAEEAEHPSFYKAYQSNAYQVTYNPGTGWLCSRCNWSCCSCVTSLTSCGVTLSSNTLTLCEANLTMCKDGCQIGFFSSRGWEGDTYGCHIGPIMTWQSTANDWRNVAIICNGKTCIYYGNMKYNPNLNSLCASCYLATCMMCSANYVASPVFRWAGTGQGGSVQMIYDNGDTCSCICMSNPSDIHMCAEDAYACNLYVCCLEVTDGDAIHCCGTRFGYDWCMWYNQDVQQTACMYCDGTLYLGAICKNTCSCNENLDCALGTCNWNGNCWVPSAGEIRNYLYNRCSVTAYSSGSTLFIRTQNCANWI